MAVFGTDEVIVKNGPVVGQRQPMKSQPVTVDADGNLDADDEISSPLIKFTALGGLAIKLYNRTGATSVQGQVLCADSATDDGVILCPGDEEDAIGVWLEDGVADDALGWVVISGAADVAMEDATAATHGNWVRTSTTEDGYADSTNAEPPGGTINAIDAHFREIGHCLETVAAGAGGTHQLARCVLHFN